MPIGGMPSILLMIARVQRAKSLDQLIVATSEEESDDSLAVMLRENGVQVFRGSLHDVLERYRQAAAQTDAARIVRMTGDCPLIDADVIDAVVGKLDGGEVDYASNVNPPTFPDGLDVECFTRAALETAAAEARAAYDREHVTPFIRNRGDRFRIENVTSELDLSSLRWTLDKPEDLTYLRHLADGVEGDLIASDRFQFLRVAYRLVPGSGAS